MLCQLLGSTTFLTNGPTSLLKWLTSSNQVSAIVSFSIRMCFQFSNLSNLDFCSSLGDFYVINGVLHTAHSIFKRYRYEFKSQALWTEIKLVLDHFAKPLTDLFVVCKMLTFVFPVILICMS